jgi:hypothetical protein
MVKEKDWASREKARCLHCVSSRLRKWMSISKDSVKENPEHIEALEILLNRPKALYFI